MRLVLILALMAALPVSAKQSRSATAKAEFQRTTPCPATGQRRGKCPGYVIDHVDPLCNYGADRPANMQWQTVGDAKIKDREERRLCARKYNKLPSGQVVE